MTEPVYFPRLMEVVPIDIFGVHVDVPFPAPLGIKQAQLEEFGAKICDPAKGLGLRADQIRLKKWDELYGYELSAQFFGEIEFDYMSAAVIVAFVGLIPVGVKTLFAGLAGGDGE